MNDIPVVQLLVQSRLTIVDAQNTDIFKADTEPINQIPHITTVIQFNGLVPIFTQMKKQFHLYLYRHYLHPQERRRISDPVLFRLRRI
jgi:hypothetical protein